MDRNELSYWKDIWKLKFNIEKYEILYIESQNITVEYKLNREIIKVNEEYCLGVDFDDDTSKADNYILFGFFVYWHINSF